MAQTIKPASSARRSVQLRAVAEQAAGCVRCELHQRATQTVFGEGPATAKLMLVGEQPGDKEDRAGKPFVGPAGSILDRALEELGVERRSVYLTNVVKHFRWEPSGKRRIHKMPSVEHVRICLPWFDQEIAIVRPEVVVCIGAVAARALLGSSFKLTRARGQFVGWDRPGRVLATVHPSSVLRSDDRKGAFRLFVRDLAIAAEALSEDR
jgi:uracil-DNA glycosylase family protein